MATDPGRVPPEWEGTDRRRVIDEIALMAASTAAAAAYLVVLGLLLADRSLTAPFTLAFLVSGILIDLGSELWMLLKPYGYSSPRLRRVIRAHYAVEGIAYVALAAAVMTGSFYAYALFMLLWMAGFVAGELIVVFLDDRKEPRRDMED